MKKHLAGPAGEFHLDVSLVDDTAIHRMNREYRGKDKPTDVLSFPQWEGEVWAFPGDEEDEPEPVELGDMVISADTALRQAGELKHSLEDELAFLTIHGVLHLLGYDHVTGPQRRTMWKWQEQIWETWQALTPKAPES